jgi:two-component system, NtrC family, response regulator HydG
MRADDLQLDEIVTFAEGDLSFLGRRLVLHGIHAMAQLRVDLVGMVGPEHTRRIFTRFGYFHGQAGAAVLKRSFEWESTEEWLRAGVRLQMLQGSARASVKSLTLEPFRMEVIWHQSGEAEEHLLAFKRAEAPICWILTGYVSGYASFCLGKDVYFIEQRCLAHGERFCLAMGRERAAWGAALEPHLEFFQPDDIQGRIRQLGAELRDKSAELQQHRERLLRLERRAAPGFAEVRSRAYQQVLDLCTRVAPFDSPVLIVGESGVGKEVLARHLHEHSPRASGPFLAVNCAALPETLLEAELFGHTAGAFTGAVRDRLGLFAEARGGTVLLDEIGEMGPALQVKLLRVLQEKEVLRLGENVPRPIDVRLLATTNRDLGRAVAEGAFREDLYYRLSVIEVRVPPLRERPEDILPLARLFVRTLARKLKLPNLRLDAACLDRLQRYAWPGNVRELQNALERAAVLSPDGMIRGEGLPPAVLAARAPAAAPAAGARGERSLAAAERSLAAVERSLAAVEREHIEAMLRLTGGHRARAARILGISTSTLWRKLKARERTRPRR